MDLKDAGVYPTTYKVTKILSDMTANNFFVDKTNYPYVFMTIRDMLVHNYSGAIFVHIPYENTKTHLKSYLSIYLDTIVELNKWFGKFFDMSVLEDDNIKCVEFEKYWIKTDGFEDLS